MIEDQLLTFVQTYPWAAKFIFWAGSARLLLKWVSGTLQHAMDGALWRMAEDEEGRELVRRGLRSVWYRTFAFLIDLTCSVKLPTLASFETKWQTTQNEK